MASKKGNFVGRFARGAALAAAIGSGKPASATPTEQNQASQIYRSQNSARNDAKLAINNEDEATGLEIDHIQASLESGGNDSSSLETTSDGSAGVKLKLKFDVPSSAQTQLSPSARRTQRNSSTQNQTQQTDPSTPDTVPDTPDQGEGTEENPFPLADAESNPSSKEGTKEGDEENEDQSEEDQSAFLDQALQEEQVREQQLEQERGKKKQEVQQKRNLGMRVLQQTQGQEMSMKQDQQASQKMNRVMRIKQKLDQKIKNLRLKKLPLQVALRTLQVSKLFILIARGLLAIVIAILYFTIILAIIGLILKGLDWLLKFIQYGISELIDLLEKQIKTIDEKIDKAKKDREKAVNVIQSIQRQKRSGPRAPTPKFDVPQAT